MIRFALAALLFGTAARAADTSVGVELGLAMDLGDRVSGEYAQFGPGPALRIPVYVALGEAARVRVIGSATLGFGSDRVTWGQYIDGDEVRFYSDEHWAMAAVGALTAGMDATAPWDKALTPYAGVDLGVAWVGTYHSFGEETQLLLDPEQNDLASGSNVDPYTTQATFLTDLHAGVSYDLSDKLALHAETGYSVAFLKAEELRKSPAELSARREAYGWNPVRLGVGLSAAF